MAALSIVESPKGHFVLNGDLNRNTIPNAPESSIAVSHPLFIDMTGVEHTDTAGLAWLINLLKQARQQGLKCELKGLPKTLINLAKISDVDSFLSVQ